MESADTKMPRWTSGVAEKDRVGERWSRRDEKATRKSRYGRDRWKSKVYTVGTSASDKWKENERTCSDGKVRWSRIWRRGWGLGNTLDRVECRFKFRNGNADCGKRQKKLLWLVSKDPVFDIDHTGKGRHSLLRSAVRMRGTYTLCMVGQRDNGKGKQNVTPLFKNIAAINPVENDV